jgi:PDZ domain-containing protein
MNQSQDAATMVALQFLGYDLVPEVEGAFVVQLASGSPAEAALKLGDLIVGVDDTDVRSSQDLSDTIGSKVPGDEVVLHLRRTVAQSGGSGADADAEMLDIPIVLAEHPDRPGAGFLGVHIETPVKADAPFDVSIDVGRVRGPSAGLAFALSVLDVLTEGELTGGERVATTGTIDRSGLVGPVGGVPQKTEAAVHAGIGVFLVPPFEYVAAAQAAHGRLDVRCVQTFDDALLALAEYGGNGPALAEQFRGSPLEPSRDVVDPDDGYFSCTEAAVELGGADDLAAGQP